ncbi:metallophosphoesterase family protein [Salirhabdus sp. Marseille-P4669]|uniref:metallophosphoesterase family protein n=1 Tax=Salirhabdus sp. Marseille-P4669 TaxID=2042310 RepID=UPI000C799166|nr:DNA repair exonuclease [Salirhabdus sp. Marseille-P4669]
MKESIRFIHAADLHLDSPFKGLTNIPKHIFNQIVNSTFSAFQNVIEHAINQKVDFVVFVGDLFDEDARSLKAQLKLKQGLDKLKENGIAVYISYGNHDHVGGDFFEIEYPKNVFVFDAEKVKAYPFYKDGKHVADIYGFSYGQRAVTANKVMEYEVKQDQIYTIGMLHGSLATNQEHDVYAPFRLTDLQDSKIDYWALGHIHKREELMSQPVAVYPGNIQGRHIKETGSKGCYLVELQEDGNELTFLPTQQIRFEVVEIDATTCGTIDELEELLRLEKEDWRNKFGLAVVRVHVNMDESKLPTFSIETAREIQEVLNEMEEEELTWVWLEQLKVHVKTIWNKEEVRKGKHFTGELLRTIDGMEDLTPLFVEVTEHRTVRKMLEPFRLEELEEIRENATNLLMEELMKE